MKWRLLVKRVTLTPLFYNLINIGQNRKSTKQLLGVDVGFDYCRVIEGVVELSADESAKVETAFRSLFNKKGISLFSMLLKKWKMQSEELIRTANALPKKNLSKKSNEQLLNIFKILESKYYVFSTAIDSPLSLGDFVEKEIKEYLDVRIKDRNKFSEYFNALTTPEQDNAGTKELISLFNIALSVKTGKLKLNKSDKNLAKKINLHIKKFGWMNTRGFYGDAWTFDEVFERLNELVKNDCGTRRSKLKNKHNQVRKNTEKILKEMNADKDFIKLVKFTKELVAFRTDRMDAYVKAGFIARPLFKEIAKRLSLDMHDIFFMLISEIKDALLNGKDYSKLVEERKKAFAFFMTDGKASIISGNELEIFKEKEGKKEIADVDEIKGTIANHGIAKGIVKIINSKRDLYKVEKGDIIVASMTIPEYVPAMERAAAFVTDEGGILCHAAIMSREMNKPCVIGTNIATKVLKDGNYVEVDANKGIVRKIKTSK